MMWMVVLNLGEFDFDVGIVFVLFVWVVIRIIGVLLIGCDAVNVIWLVDGYGMEFIICGAQGWNDI